MLLNYLSNIWRSLEMPLISCRVVLKLRWKKHCVLSALGFVNADNDDSANSDNVIFYYKDTKLYVSLLLYQQKIIKNYQNFLVKNLKDQCVGMAINQKIRIKIRLMIVAIFSNQLLWELIDCLF